MELNHQTSDSTEYYYLASVGWTESTLSVLEENTMHLPLISGYLLVIITALTHFIDGDWSYQTELKQMPSKIYQS